MSNYRRARVAVFNTLGGATSQTGKESGSGWAVCEQVSAQARQTRSPIPAVTAPGMEMFPSSYVPRHEVNIGIEPFILSLSDPFIAAVRPFSTLIRAPCPLLNELAQPGSSSRGGPPTDRGPEDPAWQTTMTSSLTGTSMALVGRMVIRRLETRHQIGKHEMVSRLINSLS